MTLNFPDSPSTGDIYNDSTSGFQYEWNGTVWISTDPQRAANIKELDDISGSFNGSTTQFNLRVSSSAVEPVSDAQLLISVGGVMQNPTNDYTVVGSTITFTTAPSAGLTFFGTFLGQALSLNTVQDGTVSNSSFKAGTAGVGIQSAGSQIGVGITNLNFIGTGNTFVAIGNTVNVSVNVGGIDTTGTSYFNNITASGNLNVTGDLTYDEVTAVNQKISGVTTTTGLDVLGISSVKDLRSVGVTTLTTGSATNFTVTNLVGTGVTATNLNTTNATITGIATVTGIIDGNGGANISGGAGLVASSAKVSDLTSGRVTYAGGSGELQDNAGLTFDGTTLAATRLAAPVAFTTSLTAANVDVTGITTFRDDVTFKGAAANITFDKSTDDLIFDDNAEAKFGTGGDLRVYHSGSKSYIKDAGTGSLRINSDDFRIYNAADSEYMLQAVENGAVTLYFDSSAKINTTSVGVNVVGNVDCDSINNAGISTFGGAATLNGNTTFGADVTFGGASSATALVWDKSVDDLIFADGAQAKFGTGGDLSIYSNGSDSFFASNTGNIDFRTTNAGSINLRADDKYGIYIQNSGTVRLYHDNSAKIETTSVGVNVTGNVDCDSLNNAGISTFTGSISLPDSSGSTVGRVRIGNSQDLQIYHSSYSYLSESSGRLYLQSNRLYVQSASGENMIYAEGDAGVNLYHNASSRLATTNAGVTVTGTVAATSYTGDGSSLTGVGASTAPMAYNPPVSSTRPATVGVALTFNQQVKAGSGNINLRQVSTSGTITQAFTVTDATEVAFAQSDLREMSLLGVNELLPDSVYCIDIPASAIDDSTGSYVGTAYTFYTQSASLNMMAWGRNNVGQLAQGASASDSDKASRSSPIQIADGSSTWKYVPHGHTEDAYNAGAIKADNTLWTWGYNQDGVLGQNQAAAQFQETASPVQVPGTNWNGLNCSVNQNWWLATKTDGTMWTWGRNSHGQLGQGNRTSYSSPNQLPGTTWSSTSQGFMNCGNYYTSYATKTDGTLWSWGLADNGSLGQGPAASCSSPKQIPGTTWKEVAAAQQAGAAIKTDGTLFVWGNGTNGQMGNGGTTASNPSPIQVPGTTWTQISGMSQGWVATKTDGTIWTWGRNEQGQLGLNNRTDKSSPEQVGSGTDWISAHSNRNNACIAVKTDGTLWMWGAGDEGLTGINKSAPTGGTVSSPVQIPGKWTNTTSAPAQNGVRPHQIGVQGSYAMALEYDLGG